MKKEDMEIDWVELSTSQLPEGVDKEFIIKQLPKSKTKIVSVKQVDHAVRVKLFTACTTTDEVKAWMNNFETITKSSYSITVTKNTSGQLVDFKQYLHCQHKTHSTKNNKRTRNTNCPATVTLTLHARKKRPSRGKDESRNKLIREMPCEIDLILTHNHNIEASFRKVSEDVKEQLIGLFDRGHSPATALQMIKIDIFLNHNNDYEDVLADRKHCPDYNYCYNLYMNHFNKKYEPLEFDSTRKEWLARRLDEYNKQMKDYCAELVFHGWDYVICICPPLSKRVHQHCESASQAVFLDSSGTIDQDDSRIFFLLTHGDCGGLPLGVIITSSGSSDIIQMGFQLLKDMVGDSAIFGGHPDGPSVFLTHDSGAEQAALRNAWTKSECFLCDFHVLRLAWKWLTKARNNIPEQQQFVYFNDLKSVLYSKTAAELARNYENARTNAVHGNYVAFLEDLWQIRVHWVLAYRSAVLSRGDNNRITEVAMRIVKEKIVDRVQAFNVVQMVDFILTKLETYYEIRLMDVADNRQHEKKSVSNLSIYVPPTGLLKRIAVLAENILVVPSENAFHVVNLDALTCTCLLGTTRICRHIHWAAVVKHKEYYNADIDAVSARQCLRYIATGIRPYSDSYSNQIENQSHAVIAASASSPTKEADFAEDATDIKENTIEFENTTDFENTIEIVFEETTDSEEHTVDFAEDTTDTVQFITTDNARSVKNAKKEEQMKEIQERARAVSDMFYNLCMKHGDESPGDVGLGLEKMLQNMNDVTTTEAFVSACSNFAMENQVTNEHCMIPVQTRVTARRKAAVADGLPRIIKKATSKRRSRRSSTISMVDRMILWANKNISR